MSSKTRNRYRDGIRRTRNYKRSEKGRDSDTIPKIVSKRYDVTSQTAYHVRHIALSNGLTEGRVIDKIVRTYLAMCSMEGQEPDTK